MTAITLHQRTSASRSIFSARTRLFLIDVLTVAAILALAGVIRHIGSIPGVFNGADLLALILAVIATLPAKSAVLRLRNR